MEKKAESRSVVEEYYSCWNPMSVASIIHEGHELDAHVINIKPNIHHCWLEAKRAVLRKVKTATAAQDLASIGPETDGHPADLY